MSLISYAQNFEDIMLWRTLKHIENGFYVDVGAWSPDYDSVTRLFYEKGWHGINIEPNPEMHKQLIYKRRRDINLQLAVSDSIGIDEMYFVSNSGLSTLDKKIAEKHIDLGLTYNSYTVKVSTLSQIFEEYTQNIDIHFLKIDVEGFEKKVLLGNNWKLYRPWIILVEATLPMSQIECYEDWEYILINENYEFVYADGLNRFYIAREHLELKDSFKYPPNVFDDFVRLSQVEAENRAVEAENRAIELEKRLIETENKIIELFTLYNSLLNSKSWKITYPLRLLLGRFARWFKTGTIAWITFAPESRPRRVTRKLIIRAKEYLNKRPKLKSLVKFCLKPFPGLQERLKRVGNTNNYGVYHSESSSEIQYSNLSPTAKKIYNDLKRAIEERKKDENLN